VVSLNEEVGSKRLELLHELVPTAAIIALLVNPANPISATLSRDAQAAARHLGLQLHVLYAGTERELDTVFATLAQLRAGALVIGNDAYFISRNEATEAAIRMRTVRLAELVGFSRAKSRPICRSCNQPSSSWSSISRLPKRWASPSRRRCLPLADEVIE
jgi:putative ABC transport system substrate-binding protein